MAIEFACQCGKRYQVGDEFIGRQVTCQTCRATLTVPGRAKPATPAARKPAPGARAGVRPAGGSRGGAGQRPAAVTNGASRQREPDLDFRDDVPSPTRRRKRGNTLALVGCFSLFLLGTLAAGGGLVFYFWEDIKSSHPKWFGKSNNDSASSGDGDKTADNSDKKSPDSKGADTKGPETKAPDNTDPLVKNTDPKKPDPKLVDVAKPEILPTYAGPWKGTTSPVLAVAISKDGKTVWTAGGSPAMETQPAATEDNSLRQWDAEGKQIGWLKDFKHGIGCAAFEMSLGGDLAAIVPIGGPLDPGDPNALWKKGSDTQVHLWDLRRRKQTHLLEGNAFEVNCVAIAPGGLHVASAGRDRSIHINNADSGAVEDSLNGHTGTINAVVFSPDASRLASGGLDKTVRVWDRAGRKEEFNLRGHKDAVWALAFSPSGQQLVSGGGGGPPESKDYSVRVWDLTKGSELVVLNGHTDRVTAVGFSVDGARVVSGSKDGTVRIWQVSTGKSVGQVNVMVPVTSLAVAPDGRRALIGASDGSLRYWVFPADVASVIKKLDNALPAERLAALRELTPYGADARPARALLLKLAVDPDKEVRVAALALLMQFGMPEKTEGAALTQILSMRDCPEGRVFALDGLAAIGAEAKPAIALLTEALMDPEASIRIKAATALGAIGADAKAMAFVPMLALIGDKDPMVVEAAANALTKLGKPEREHTKAVADLLNNPNEPVRRFALSALTELGPAAADAGPALMALLAKETVAGLRKQCLLALAQVMPGSKELLMVYTTSLADADPEISKAAAGGLARIGTAGGAMPALLSGLDNPNNEVIQLCLEALAKGPIAKEQAMLLRNALHDTKKDPTRRSIIALLGKMGPDAADALPGVIEVMKVGNADVRKDAVTLCGIIGPPAKSAGPAIAALLNDADAAFKLEIAQTLQKTGSPEVSKALPALVKGLKIENSDAEAEIAARKQVSEALVAIGKDAVDPLLTALEKDFAGKEKANVEARIVVLQTLQGMGTKAKGALGRLFKIKNEDPSLEVRKAAKMTIDKVQ